MWPFACSLVNISSFCTASKFLNPLNLRAISRLEIPFALRHAPLVRLARLILSPHQVHLSLNVLTTFLR